VKICLCCQRTKKEKQLKENDDSLEFPESKHAKKTKHKKQVPSDTEHKSKKIANKDRSSESEQKTHEKPKKKKSTTTDSPPAKKSSSPKSSHSSSESTENIPKQNTSKNKANSKELITDATPKEKAKDKSKNRTKGDWIYLGVDNNPNMHKIPISEATVENIAAKMGFRMIKYLIDSQHEIALPRKNGKFKKLQPETNYIVVGLPSGYNRCSLCKKDYLENEKRQRCKYHPGELVEKSKMQIKKVKDTDTGEVKKIEVPEVWSEWSCCGQNEQNSKGCKSAKNHAPMLK